MNKDTLFMGIDCGKYGAISITDIHGNLLYIHDMPLNNYDVDNYELKDIMSKYSDKDIYVTVEQMFPGFKRSEKCEIWQQARNYQSILSILAFYKFRYRLITAKTWQHKFIEGKASKSKSINLAIKKTKRHDVFIKGKDGRAEAYLIGEFGRELKLESERYNDI
jgi:hypothetical protein